MRCLLLPPGQAFLDEAFQETAGAAEESFENTGPFRDALAPRLLSKGFGMSKDAIR